MDQPRPMPERAALSVLGILSLCVAVPLGLALFAFPVLARPFATLFEEFGGTIPFVTQAAMTWLGPMLGVIVAGLLAVGLRAPGGGLKQLLLIAAALLAVVGLGGCYVALQWPIFRLAGQIAQVGEARPVAPSARRAVDCNAQKSS